MSRRLVVLAILIAAAVSSPAWGCGGDGQPPCGGECDWYVAGTCPFCIPWCSRRQLFCNSDEQLGPGDLDKGPVCHRIHQPLPFPVLPPLTFSVNAALRDGCFSREALQSIRDATLQRTNLGTITRRKLEDYTPRDQWATRFYVTDPNTPAYRAPTIPNEDMSLTSGHLISKAQNKVSKLSPDQVSGFWARNGPLLGPTAPPDLKLELALRMLATSSSDEPPSQFVSVALDFRVAEGFGNDVIYKFYLAPDSPILGLRQCDRTKGGELQFQVPGGTPIHLLQRYHRPKNRQEGYWEKWESGAWARESNEQ
jgi:hypothetical protein